MISLLQVVSRPFKQILADRFLNQSLTVVILVVVIDGPQSKVLVKLVDDHVVPRLWPPIKFNQVRAGINKVPQILLRTGQSFQAVLLKNLIVLSSTSCYCINSAECSSYLVGQDPSFAPSQPSATRRFHGPSQILPETSNLILFLGQSHILVLIRAL